MKMNLIRFTTNFKKCEKPIFKMMSLEDSAKNQWFHSLFKGLTFDQQWEKLEELLNNK